MKPVTWLRNASRLPLVLVVFLLATSLTGCSSSSSSPPDNELDTEQTFDWILKRFDFGSLVPTNWNKETHENDTSVEVIYDSPTGGVDDRLRDFLVIGFYDDSRFQSFDEDPDPSFTLNNTIKLKTANDLAAELQVYSARQYSLGDLKFDLVIVEARIRLDGYSVAYFGLTENIHKDKMVSMVSNSVEQLEVPSATMVKVAIYGSDVYENLGIDQLNTEVLNFSDDWQLQLPVPENWIVERVNDPDTIIFQASAPLTDVLDADDYLSIAFVSSDQMSAFDSGDDTGLPLDERLSKYGIHIPPDSLPLDYGSSSATLPARFSRSNELKNVNFRFKTIDGFLFISIRGETGNMPALALLQDKIFEQLSIQYTSKIGTKATASWSIPGSIGGLAYSPEQDSFWVSNSANREILLFDAPSGNLLNTIRLENPPAALKLSVDGKKLYVVTELEDAVASEAVARVEVIDSVSLNIVGSHHVYFIPSDLAETPTGDLLVTGLYADSRDQTSAIYQPGQVEPGNAFSQGWDLKLTVHPSMAWIIGFTNVDRFRPIYWSYEEGSPDPLQVVAGRVSYPDTYGTNGWFVGDGNYVVSDMGSLLDATDPPELTHIYPSREVTQNTIFSLGELGNKFYTLESDAEYQGRLTLATEARYKEYLYLKRYDTATVSQEASKIVHASASELHVGEERIYLTDTVENTTEVIVLDRVENDL